MTDRPSLRFRLASSLEYLWRARSRYFLHSPYVFDFYENVLREPVNFPEIQEIHAYRNALLRDESPIERMKADAAGRMIPNGRQPLNRILKRETCPPAVGAFLFRWSRHYRPARVLELGVNLGLSGAYLQRGNPEMEYFGVEGNPAMAALAERHFKELRLKGQTAIQTFDEFLKSERSASFDLIYLDGNHRYAETLRYIKALLPRLNAGGCLMLDDIRWSAGMNRAWREACALPEVSVSIELYRLGMMLVGREQAREHFVLWSPQGV